MKKNSVRIEPVRLKDLKSFLERYPAMSREEGVVPISRARARAQMKNPHARGDDIVLLVAFLDGLCVGYHGQLPGLFFHENVYYPILWGSTFYVDPNLRGLGIGVRLLEQVAELGQDFVITQMTPHVQKVLRRFGLRRLGSLTYYQFRAEKAHVIGRLFEIRDRLSESFRWRRENRRGRAGILERAVHGIEKRIFYSLMEKALRKMSDGFFRRRVKTIRHQLFSRNDRLKDPHFYRGPEVVNWMIENPWILSGKEGNAQSDRYYFSSLRDHFQYIPLEIYSRGKKRCRGFMVLSVSSYKSRTTVKVLDHCWDGKEIIAPACASALFYARKYSADRVELPWRMGEFLKRYSPLPSFLKKQSRPYLYLPCGNDSPLDKAASQIRLGCCDGDTAFT